MSLWAEMARKLDIEIIAPQHGALFRGKPMVQKFIDWCAGLEYGVDLMAQVYMAPVRVER
jgi:flavorubredoxin